MKDTGLSGVLFEGRFIGRGTRQDTRAWQSFLAPQRGDVAGFALRAGKGAESRGTKFEARGMGASVCAGWRILAGDTTLRRAMLGARFVWRCRVEVGPSHHQESVMSASGFLREDYVALGGKVVEDRPRLDEIRGGPNRQGGERNKTQ